MENKQIKSAYWISLVLMTIVMLISSVPCVLKLDYAVEHFCKVLKLPEYLLVFTGLTKLIGLMLLYIPNISKIKEWVFAGFAFDLMGAWYCNFRGMNSFTATIPIIIFMVILFAVYYFNKKLNASKI
ncbi:hypothetical protein BH11BAC4_BH11BAC4_09230 [soil metagenome]